jgi:hypothetical protein
MPLERPAHAALLGSILVLALGLTGCAGARGAQAVDRMEGAGGRLAEAPSADASVQEELAQYVLGARRVDGVQVVALELENRGEAALAFAWTVEWYTRSGERVLDLGAGWAPAQLAPGQRLSLELVAPAPGADSWKLLAVAMP